MTSTNRHYANGAALQAPFPAGTQTAVFGLGCLFGAQRLYRGLDGVVSTAVDYACGLTQNPTYEKVCLGLTGHAEVVLVVFDPKRISDVRLLQVFFESHNPTQGMRQGNDRGTQYQSVIQYAGLKQRKLAQAAADACQKQLNGAKMDLITTRLEGSSPFFYA